MHGRPVLRTLTRAVTLLLAAVCLAAAALAGNAQASVSIAITWDGLIRQSTASAVVTPIEANAVWENGRIYTYTRVRVDRTVAGDLPAGSDAWVRTMGGVVGKIGQIVEGEAVLTPGETSLLFVRAAPIGTLEVTARGQGQFPVLASSANSPPRVVRSHAVGALVPPQLIASSPRLRLAADVLHGRTVDEVAVAIVADWEPMHAHP
ncbi:MAG: hypothetical protein M3O46_15480 [Myxococcota bacterium]|nr:hypothetical protein [Myxococcota bacterium]